MNAGPIHWSRLSADTAVARNVSFDGRAAGTFLQRLLLVHGQWSYARQARLIFYQFYVQLLLNTILFYFQFSTAFTQQVRRARAARLRAPDGAVLTCTWRARTLGRPTLARCSCPSKTWWPLCTIRCLRAWRSWRRPSPTGSSPSSA